MKWRINLRRRRIDKKRTFPMTLVALRPPSADGKSVVHFPLEMSDSAVQSGL
jgi:hypothetical protein